jgi:hypothetical protein
MLCIQLIAMETKRICVCFVIRFDSIRAKLQTQGIGTRGPPYDDDIWYSTIVLDMFWRCCCAEYNGMLNSNVPVEWYD